MSHEVVQEDVGFAARACEAFGFPAPTTVRAVAGGLQHRLLRLDFPFRAPLALKILAPRSTSTSSDVERFERAETLAEIAARGGVPALVALRQTNGAFVGRLENSCFLMYPWAEGQTLPPHAVSPERARQMGAFLARLHALEVRFPGQSAPVPEAFDDGHFHELCRLAHEQNASWAPQLNDAVSELERLNARARAAQIELQNNWVTGHLDFDQKNVLWNRGEPLVLDWEQAKAISPALEALGAGLLWAGQSAGAASKTVFLAWLEGYRKHNKLRLSDLELASDGVIGKWMIWLEFNLGRLLDANVDEREQKIAFGAAIHALGATLKLGEDGALYRAWCREAFTT